MFKNDRFVRWQGALRDQLTFLNNLLTTIVVAVIGFSVSYLGHGDFKLDGIKKFLFTSGLIALMISVLLGISVGYSRLKDFRYTLLKLKDEKTTKDRRLLLKNKMKFYGDLTWNLFYSQLLFSFMGLLLLSIAFLIIFQNELF